MVAIAIIPILKNYWYIILFERELPVGRNYKFYNSFQKILYIFLTIVLSSESAEAALPKKKKKRRVNAAEPRRNLEQPS